MESHVGVLKGAVWTAVVARELAARNRFLPPLWGDLSLRTSLEPVTEVLRSSLERRFPVEPEVTILARKKSRGARPLARLGLRERVLYRALSEAVAKKVEVSQRDDEAYRLFGAAPLELEDVTYVLKLDIASYYEYVDHQRLVDEVISQTASSREIAAIVDLLSESSGKTFGLPQMTDASDSLAEIYIDPMRRQLARAGYRVSRFADDFRIACRSYEEALSALDSADEAARSLGLVLSDTKTRIVGIEKYRLAVRGEDSDEPEQEIDSEWMLSDGSEYLDEDLLVWSAPATGAELEEVDHPATEEIETAIEAPSDDAQRVAADYIEELVAARRNDESHHGETHVDSTVQLQRAIKILARARNPKALANAPALIVYEPVCTPYLAAYLRACADGDRAAVVRSLGQISTSGITSPWQQVWIAFVAGDIERRSTSKTNSHISWLHSLMNSGHPAVVAEAALALARRGFAKPDQVGEVLGRLPSVHRSTALLALAALGDESRALAAADGLLDQHRVRWGLETLA